ncbi:CoA transferase [Bordetella petrii]|nr:CoA transferase [Bordetella petrii]
MLENLESDFPAHPPRAAGAPTVLEGIRVVDFTHFVAGPFATMILADMGADVIKIEAPDRGEEFRHYPPIHPELPAQGAPYLWSNRNKRSLAINMKTPEGVAVVRELIAQADVVVENFSTGVMERFGLDYGSCNEINPRIIYCSVSAYGREGDFADRSGFDPIVQAESGFISMNGYGDREGVRTLAPVIDIGTATMACNAILGALLARHRTGQGQAVEVALYDNAMLMTGYAMFQHIFTGATPQRNGNNSPDTCPTGVFHAKDKPFFLNCSSNKMFVSLATRVVDRPDLADDPRFASTASRVKHREQLLDILGAAFARQPFGYWQPRMRAASLPCGEVRTIAEAVRSPETRARRLITRIKHAATGWVPNLALPIRYGATPLADPRPAPALGQHTAEVLRDVLGYDEARIAVLRAAGALNK